MKNHHPVMLKNMMISVIGVSKPGLLTKNYRQLLRNDTKISSTLNCVIGEKILIITNKWLEMFNLLLNKTSCRDSFMIFY